MIRLLYSLIYVFSLISATPWLLYLVLGKKRLRCGWRARFGKLPENLQWEPGDPQCIWFHAASVGEVLAAGPVVRKLSEEIPELRIVMSTMTCTGSRVAKEKIPELAAVFQIPLDVPVFIRRVIDRINPICLVIIETEIWPNLIFSVSERKIPIHLINGRISSRSFPRYRLFKFFFRAVFRHITGFAMQTQQDAERIIHCGAHPDQVTVTGNVKYDIAQDSLDTNNAEAVVRAMKWRPEDRIIVAGSTHSGEESILCEMMKTLLKTDSGVRLVLAPRHLNRVDEVVGIVKNSGLSFALRSRTAAIQDADSVSVILILDTIGELAAFYHVADIAFVGGSLVNIGGHNVLEPAGAGKPVIFGPHIQNFKDAAKQLLENNAAKQVKDRFQLIETVQTFLENPELCADYGDRALDVVLGNRGAVERNIRRIESTLFERDPVPGSDTFSGSGRRAFQTERRSMEDRIGDQPRTASDWVFHRAARVMSVLYAAVVRGRNAAFTKNILRSRHAPGPVISVGNLTVGGSGKTPLTIYIAGKLKDMQYRPCIISRGYKGKSGRIPVRVPINGSVREFGDEPVMMARQLPDIPIIVSRNRVDGARWAFREQGVNCFVLDDGFQHRKIARDLDIVVIDSRKPVTLDRMLPAGHLREPVNSLSRADCIVFSHSNRCMPAESDIQAIRSLRPGIPIFYGQHRIVGVRRINDAGTNSSSGKIIDLKGYNAGLISGIADSEAFWKTAEQTGARVVADLSFPDHHAFTPEDVDMAVEATRRAGGDCLIATAKDEVRLPHSRKYPEFPVFVIDIIFELKEMVRFENVLREVLD